MCMQNYVNTILCTDTKVVEVGEGTESHRGGSDLCVEL